MKTKYCKDCYHNYSSGKHHIYEVLRKVPCDKVEDLCYRDVKEIEVEDLVRGIVKRKSALPYFASVERRIAPWLGGCGKKAKYFKPVECGVGTKQLEENENI